MALAYPPFRNNKRLNEIISASKWLRYGENSVGVMLVQGGLIELGASMPATLKTGVPDGIYGDETFRAVKDFQTKHSLGIDGIAGGQTIGAMDGLLVAKTGVPSAPHVPGVPKVQPAPVPTDSHYTIGTADPHYTPDPGAGGWKSKESTYTYIALKAAILRILPPFPESVATSAATGPNAMRHMLHYFGNHGRDLTINMESMISAREGNKKRLAREAYQAKKFCEKLGPGTHSITSLNYQGEYNYKHETTDWFFATGGYMSFGKGTVTITADDAGVQQYDLSFEFKMVDKYNWDGGKKVEILGIEITDEFMAEFHRQGLAKEFTQYGTAHRRIRWTHGSNLPPADVQTPVGGTGR